MVILTTPVPTEALPTPENTIKMEKKETPYGKRGDSGALLAIQRRSCRVAELPCVDWHHSDKRKIEI